MNSDTPPYTANIVYNQAVNTNFKYIKAWDEDLVRPRIMFYFTQIIKLFYYIFVFILMQGIIITRVYIFEILC